MVKLTCAPLMLHTDALAGAMEKLTGNPEVAVAATVYGAPPTRAGDGGVEVKVIVCDAGRLLRKIDAGSATPVTDAVTG